MIYRCRSCQHEEARGFLPAVTTGLYAMALLGLSVGCLTGVARVSRAMMGDPPAPTDPVDPPWWFGALAVVAGLVIVVVGMVVINFALELAEWLAFARRRCPACGSHRWSWGYTRGFGL